MSLPASLDPTGTGTLGYYVDLLQGNPELARQVVGRLRIAREWRQMGGGSLERASLTSSYRVARIWSPGGKDWAHEVMGVTALSWHSPTIEEAQKAADDLLRENGYALLGEVSP